MTTLQSPNKNITFEQTNSLRLYVQRSLSLLFLACLGVIAYDILLHKGLLPPTELWKHYQIFFEAIKQGIFIPIWDAQTFSGLGSPTLLFTSPLPFWLWRLMQVFVRSQSGTDAYIALGVTLSVLGAWGTLFAAWSFYFRIPWVSLCTGLLYGLSAVYLFFSLQGMSFQAPLVITMFLAFAPWVVWSLVQFWRYRALGRYRSTLILSCTLVGLSQGLATLGLMGITLLILFLVLLLFFKMRPAFALLGVSCFTAGLTSFFWVPVLLERPHLQRFFSAHDFRRLVLAKPMDPSLVSGITKLPPLAEVVRGRGDVSCSWQGPQRFSCKLFMVHKSILQINIAHYPAWVFNLDQKKTVPDLVTMKSVILPQIALIPGSHELSGTLKDSPLRWGSKMISWFCFLILFAGKGALLYSSRDRQHHIGV